MKLIKFYLEDKEHRKALKAKGKLTWKEFVMQKAEKEKRK